MTRFIGHATLIVLIAACGGRSLPAGTDSGPVADGTVSEDGFIRSDSKVIPTGKVTITTDRTSYGITDSGTATVHNGTDRSIFLPGCAIFGRDFLKGGTWTDKGAVLLCGWEGKAVEVKPGGKKSQQVSFETPGSWRVTLRYGVGCKGGLPLSGASCAAFHEATSPVVKASVTKATCTALNQQYHNLQASAQKCNSALGVEQCTKMIAADLHCGCSLYVNDDTKMKKLQTKWAAYSCFKLFSPCGIYCAAPQPHHCINDRCQPK